MDKQCCAYYKNQAGMGLSAYEGFQNQRAHGWFSDISKFLYNSVLKPTGNWLLPKALEAGSRLGSDLLNGQNFKDSLKKNLKRTGEEIINEGSKKAKVASDEIIDNGLGYLKSYLQRGKGKRKRRKRKRGLNLQKRKRSKKRRILQKKSLKSKTLKSKRKKSKRKAKKNKRKHKKAKRRSKFVAFKNLI